MVNIAEFNNLLKNPNRITVPETDLLAEIMYVFPYFQVASSMYLKSLKSHHYYYKNKLQQVAAKTIDRSVLFEYIENDLIQETKTSKKIFIEKDKQDKTIKVSQNIETNFDKISQNKKDVIAEKEAQNFSHKQEKIVKKPLPDKKLTYFEWLEQLKSSKKPKKNNIFELIDKFIKDKPKITPVKGKVSKTPVFIGESIQEKQMLMTETLANLYVNQKRFDKAMQAFKILSLKYPKKSSYFANRIAKIKQNLK